MPDTQQRKLIRAAAVAILVGTAPNYATAAGVRVKPGRIAPVRLKKDLPIIGLYTDDEQAVPDTYERTPKLVERHVTLVLDCYLSIDLAPGTIDSAELEDACDDFALSVDRAFETAETAANALNGSATWCRYDSMRKFWPERAAGEKPVVCMRLTYDVAYYWTALEPDAALIETVDTRYSLGDAQAPADQAEDTQDFGS